MVTLCNYTLKLCKVLYMVLNPKQFLYCLFMNTGCSPQCQYYCIIVAHLFSHLFSPFFSYSHLLSPAQVMSLTVNLLLCKDKIQT